MLIPRLEGAMKTANDVTLFLRAVALEYGRLSNEPRFEENREELLKQERFLVALVTDIERMIERDKE